MIYRCVNQWHGTAQPKRPDIVVASLKQQHNGPTQRRPRSPSDVDCFSYGAFTENDCVSSTKKQRQEAILKFFERSAPLPTSSVSQPTASSPKRNEDSKPSDRPVWSMQSQINQWYGPV